MRVSIKIRLVRLGSERQERKGESEFERICAKFNLQIRGSHGENSVAKGHIYDVSNKGRFGRTEGEYIKDLNDGAKALIEAEKLLDHRCCLEASSELLTSAL